MVVVMWVGWGVVLWLHHIKIESSAQCRRRRGISRWGSRQFVTIKTHLRQKQIAFLTTPCNTPSCTRAHTRTSVSPCTCTYTCEGEVIHSLTQVIYQCHSESLYLAHLYNHTVYIKCMLHVGYNEAPTGGESQESPFNLRYFSMEAMRLYRKDVKNGRRNSCKE